MPDSPIALRRGTVDDLGTIIRLIEEAAEWLRAKGTDQWARPWPNRAGRDSRILASLSQGKTWIGWDNGTPAATITADPDEDPYPSAARFQKPTAPLPAVPASGPGLFRVSWTPGPRG
jgi:hypothetical protein